MSDVIKLVDWAVWEASELDPDNGGERLHEMAMAAKREHNRLRERAEKSESDYRFMIERAADEKLGGYRQLGQRAADAENERDALRAKVATLEARLDSELDEELCMLLHSGSEPGVHGPREHIDLARQARAEGRQLCTPAARSVLEVVDRRDIVGLRRGAALGDEVCEAELARRKEEQS